MMGQVLGRYEIVEELGQGGMATVYRAYQPDLDRFVALKVLAPEFARDRAFLARFRREAAIAARLHHPHIAPIYDIGESDGAPYIAMRYVPGRTLGELVDEDGPLRLERALTILRQIAAALDYAHAHGIVHRDVKPGNILIEEGDRVSLVDFGIAWVGDRTRLTQQGTLTGTPEYMAPEQALGQPVTNRTDLYALGIIAFRLLTGEVPFTAESGLAVLHRQAYDRPPSIRAFRPDLSRSADAAVQRALAKRPEDRFATAAEFVAALSAPDRPAVPVRRTTLIAGAPHPPATATAGAANAAGSRRIWPLVVAAGLLILALAGGLIAGPTFLRSASDSADSTTAARPLAGSPVAGDPGATPGGTSAAGLAVAQPTETATASPTVQVAAATPTVPAATPTAPPQAAAPTGGTPDAGNRNPAGQTAQADQAQAQATLTPTVEAQPTATQARPPAPTAPAAAASPDAPAPTQAGGAAGEATPSVPGPTGRILFASTRAGSPRSDIFLVNADGSSLQRLTTDSITNLYPDWSPDGSRFVYMSLEGVPTMGSPAGDLFIMNLDGSGRVRLTQGAQAKWPKWSPDGQWIVFANASENRSELYDIYRVRADGGPIQRLTNNPGFDGFPAWTPDGRIVFTRGNQLAIMNADGSQPQALTSGSGDRWYPVVSPDGRRIAFASNRTGSWDIFTLALDGSDLRAITADASEDYNPSWSPDGQWIAFHSNRAGGQSWDVYLVPSAGGEIRRLTTHPAPDNEPAWHR